jgi:nucleotide-binding universal stress UspA family protein
VKAPPKVLLVPVDFSDVSHRALEHAQMLARLVPDARIVLVHVVDATPTPMATDFMAQVPRTDMGAEADAAKKGLIAWAKGSPNTTSDVRTGAPADEILAAAKDAGAEMIVIGTHGRKGVARALLGSVAEDVARRASVPVVLVH